MAEGYRSWVEVYEEPDELWLDDSLEATSRNQLENAERVDQKVSTISGPEQIIIGNELQEYVNQALANLNLRARSILLYRYGFYGDIPTYEELGLVFGISQRRVTRLEQQALMDIRKYLVRNY